MIIVWYGMVWYGMVWYVMVWYGMVWYGMGEKTRGGMLRDKLTGTASPRDHFLGCQALSLEPRDLP